LLDPFLGSEKSRPQIGEFVGDLVAIVFLRALLLGTGGGRCSLRGRISEK